MGGPLIVRRRRQSVLQPLYDIALEQVITHFARNTRAVVYKGKGTRRVEVTPRMRAILALRDALIRALALPRPKSVTIGFQNVVGYTRREQDVIQRAANAELRLERMKELNAIFQKIGIRRSVARVFTENILTYRYRVIDLINTVDDIDSVQFENGWERFVEPPDR